MGGNYQEKPRQTFYKTWTRQTCIPREIITVKNQYVHVTNERTITNIHFMIPRWYVVYQNNFMTLLVDFTWAVYMLYLFFSLVSAENFKGKIIIAAHFQTVLLESSMLPTFTNVETTVTCINLLYKFHYLSNKMLILFIVPLHIYGLCNCDN